MQTQLICRFLIVFWFLLFLQFCSAVPAVLADNYDHSPQEEHQGETKQVNNDSLENDSTDPEPVLNEYCSQPGEENSGQKLDTDLKDNQNLFNEDFAGSADRSSDSDLSESEVQLRSGAAEDLIAASCAGEVLEEPLFIEPVASAIDLQPETTDSYILIRTIEELIAVNNGLNSNYRLANDLALSESESWTPLGAAGNPFKGIFDGFDYTISGLFNNISNDHSGFFGYTSGATIKNLNLEIKQVAGGNNTGGLVGRADSSLISNCQVTIPHQPTESVSGNQNVGGLAGYAKNTEIESSSVSGLVTARDNYIGGLVGCLDGGYVTQSFSETQVVGNNNHVGGLIGISKSAVIEESYAESIVSGNSGVGGLVGYVSLAGGSTIKNSYAAGLVSGTGSVGGFAGEVAKNNILVNCHSVAGVNPTIENATSAGGLVGHSHSTSKLSSINNYWDLDDSGQETSAIGFGLTGVEMQEAASFAGFDFAEIWHLDHLLANPILKWQISEEPSGPPHPQEPGAEQKPGGELPLYNLPGGAVFLSHAFPTMLLPSAFLNGDYYRQLLKRIEQLELLVASLKNGVVSDPDQAMIIIVAELDSLLELLATYTYLLSEQERLELSERLKSLAFAVKQF